MQDMAVIQRDLSVSVPHIRRHRSGRIKIGVQSKSSVALKILAAVLVGLTIYAFASFDYKKIDFWGAVADTLHNIRTVFLEPELSTDTVSNVLYQLFVTFCLGISSTTASGSERSVLCMPVSARSSIYAVTRSSCPEQPLRSTSCRCCWKSEPSMRMHDDRRKRCLPISGCRKIFGTFIRIHFLAANGCV